MLVVGLTGNYGMGKSTVLSIFRELGAVTLDTDKVVSSFLNKREVSEKIKLLLGSDVVSSSGKINKKKIAENIFRKKDLRIGLENILHPLVFKNIEGFIKGIKKDNAVIIVETPVLFERGYETKFEKIIVVHCTVSKVIERLKSMGTDKDSAMLRLKSQIDIKEKIKKANFAISNNRSLEITKNQVSSIYERLKKEVEDSNMIKKLILSGNVREASKLLGKAYTIEGNVIKGAGRGDKLLNTPTANINTMNELIPKEGVYAVRVTIDDGVFDGVSNIGKNPTFGAPHMSYEVHIFNFSGNLLNKNLRLHFIERIRDEKTFPNAIELKTQIKEDIEKAKKILKKTHLKLI